MQETQKEAEEQKERQEQEILSIQVEDSLVTQLPSKLRETECSLKVQRESYAELSQTAGTGKQEVKVRTPLKAETKERTPLTKQNLSWGDESDYSSNEIKVVKNPRSVKKKD